MSIIYSKVFFFSNLITYLHMHSNLSLISGKNVDLNTRVNLDGNVLSFL